MKLRCVMAWQNYRVGDVIDPPAAYGQDLMAMRWCGRPFWVPVPEAAAPVIEPAIVGETENEPALTEAGPNRFDRKHKKRGNP